MAAAAPAGGAQLGQIAIVVGFVSVAYAAMVQFARAHRAGRPTRLGALAERLGTAVGVPPWAAPALALVTLSLAGVYFGLMWDMSFHIDDGRDPGPLANPAHYFILVGLYGIFASGFLAYVMSDRRSTGGLLFGVAGLFALIGFPLDDGWHRMFGQDVTLWGPTHLIMLGGGVLSIIGVAVLLAEATGRSQAAYARFARVLTCAALLVGLSAFMGEFDYGTPQFRVVLQPALIAFAAGLALVAARRWAGPGGALGASVLALGLAAWTALLVKLLGQAMPSTPLFVPEGIAVELAAFALPRRPFALGLGGGALAAASTLTAEWAWTTISMPMHWRTEMLPEAAIMALVAGLAGGTLGALLGSALRGTLPRHHRRVFALALAAFAAVMANGLVEHTPSGARAAIALRNGLTVRLDPSSLGGGYVRMIAWQGHAPRVQATLRRTGPGVYHTSLRPPTHGTWKSLILLDKGRTLLAAPIYEPADSAIPVKQVPARAQVTRPLEKTRDLLQRERRHGVPAWLWTSASLMVLVLGLIFVTVLGWGVERFAIRATSSTA